MTTTTPTLTIDMWSDVSCPFCYIGKRRLELALKQLQFVPHSASSPSDAKTYSWNFRSYEIEQSQPRVSDDSLCSRMAKKFGVSESESADMLTGMADQFKEVGLTFNWKVAKPGNTMDAHRLIQMAQEKGLGEAVNDRLMLAYFTQGTSIGDPDELEKAINDIDGLNWDVIEDVVTDMTLHFADVRADEYEALSMGVRSVPYFQLNGGKSIIDESVEPSDLVKAIQKAL